MTLSNVILAVFVALGLGVVAVVGVTAYIDHHRALDAVDIRVEVEDA